MNVVTPIHISMNELNSHESISIVLTTLIKKIYRTLLICPKPSLTKKYHVIFSSQESVNTIRTNNLYHIVAQMERLEIYIKL